MNKKVLKKVLLLLLVSVFGIKNVDASSVTISSNATNVTKGTTVKVIVKVNADAGIYTLAGSASCSGAGATGGVDLHFEDLNTSSTSKTFAFTIKPTSTGTITCSTSNVSIRELSKETEYSLNNATTTIDVTSPAQLPQKEYSSDNSLKSLNIEGYDLNPKFNKDTTEYKLTVDQSIEKINISASSTDAKASVSGTGEVNLSSGENTIEVRVTAENGNEKVYKIIVTVEDLNPISVKINKEEFVIVKKNNDLIAKLEHYEEKTIKIDNQELIAYINPTTKVTLVLLKDKDNKVDYYIYNEKSNTYEKYRYINVNGLTLQLLDTNLKLDHHKKYLLKLQDQTIDFYKLKKSHKVGLIYGTNIKTGNTSYYIYDQNEETLSKYYDDEIKIYQDEVKTLKSYLMIFMGVASFGIIITIIVSLVHSKKKKKRKYSC